MVAHHTRLTGGAGGIEPIDLMGNTMLYLGMKPQRFCTAKRGVGAEGAHMGIAMDGIVCSLASGWGVHPGVWCPSYFRFEGSHEKFGKGLRGSGNGLSPLANASALHGLRFRFELDYLV